MLSVKHLPVRTFVVALLVLLVAACSGGGCSSGCAQCGTTPLPNGFPKPETIPNAAHVRLTRPGLNFLQENMTTIAEKALGTNAPGGIVTFPIPKSSSTGFTICPPNNPVPPQCQAEIDIGKAKLRINAITPNKVKLDGTLPVRIRDLPLTMLGFFQAYVVAGDRTQAPGQNLCASNLKGAATFPYKEFPLNVELPLVTETRPPRTGYTKVDVEKGIIDIAITKDDLEICDNTCGGQCQGLLDGIKDIAFNALIGGVKNQIKDALSGAFCTAPAKGVNPPCPAGSTPNDPDINKADKCVFTGSQECLPSLLGADGHMDLGAALRSFSPGTQGGLDFVLASANDMAPKPAVAGVPAWTPRKPPVPAEDNNTNGISLTFTGGALAKPVSNCIEKEDRADPPQDIPIPKELEGDTITPWPAGTPGPHIGLALAGRYLDHAFKGAYNSGALCLGVSTEQVELLSSGYLSLLTPSIKTLTFEQQTAAAAIATRPGAAPKIKIGGGTDIEADPLLAITLERFAVDFYLFSFDRYVRLFTYTADVTVPLNLQTGKDEKNPNGGILPVIGNLTITNPSVTNNDLLQEDDVRIKDGVTGLLGGIVGSFLGGGLSPIDIQSALASAGLGLDIPQGGIRKITSGSDDFIGIFANLKPATSTAREEADTRAVITEKIIDRDRMGLGTAERTRFPKLRVTVDGIASRPTEHTWWVDNGPHAAWTTAREIVVDQDAMLLQGKHVLHVSARVVNDMASEDSTPVAIPFVVDTLPPRIDVERRGNVIDVRAWDFVSDNDALRMRYRIGDGAFSEWAPVAPITTGEENVAIEISDEEGNIGKVQLPLRGIPDPTLKAEGSGCGCRTTPAPSSFAAGLAFAAGMLLVRARRRR